MAKSKLKVIFLDIGGVLLTNGWDTASRKKAIDQFGLDAADFEKRHGMAFDIYERGQMTFDEYLENLVFFTERSFSYDEFKEFVFSQSQELPGALAFFHEIKKRSGLPIVALNNEPRDLNAYRIKKFGLDSLFSYFISSCYIGMRKPDERMYRLACDIAGIVPSEALYIDDRAQYMTTASKVGLQCMAYTGIEAARAELVKYDINV